jgi:nicotinate phosphoribosyltransferase
METLWEDCPKFVGTSNVWAAKNLGIKPIGTMAHEYIMAGQALTRVADSQKYMLQKWADEYRGHLGIALSDTLGFDAFRLDFDAYFAKLYDGCRHDSGDPVEWGNELIKHYTKMGIYAPVKTAVFSDGLDVDKMIELAINFSGRINTSFGIGTNLVNDCGPDPLQLVMKMTYCNGQPVAKVSDSPGKGMCEDEDYLRYLKQQFRID